MNTSDTIFQKSVLHRAVHYILPNSQAVTLAIILTLSFLLIYFLADLLMPVFASIVIAYLLENIIQQLEKIKLPRWFAVYFVFFSFLACLSFGLFFLLPIIAEQAIELAQNLPSIIYRMQTEIMRLPYRYPQLLSESKIQVMLSTLQQQLLTYAQNIVSFSAASVVSIVSAMIYLFLVPMMVFFFLKDKELLIAWLLRFIPKEQHLTVQFWQEIDEQIGNYVRGKLTEVLILWLISYITFTFIDLNYVMLLSVLMGLSVVIPYIGATLVTFPVLGVAYFQWGFTDDHFMYVVIAYSIIQAFDGVLLIPILFSEAVNLHAIAIVIAILFFGGLWGFWGVFLAIPLATVVKAVLNVWPQSQET